MLIWIIGASTGIGRAVARHYARAGETVCVSARREDQLKTLVDECRGAPGAVQQFVLDVTDNAAVAAAFDAVCDRCGVPDLVICNAGTSVPDSVRHFDRGTYARIMEVNYMGVVNCLQPVIPAFIGRGHGRIAVVASVAGYRGLPGAAAYCASKAALISLCESLQPELHSHGVRLQLVDPGFVRTPLTDKNRFPMPFLMKVEDAAAAMVDGLATGRFETTFPKRFTWWVKALRFLPFPLYLRLTRMLVSNA